MNNNTNGENLSSLVSRLSSNPDDERYMRMALREAEKAFDEGEIPIGCVVVKDGVVIGKGHNQIEMLKVATAHAEILSIGTAASTLDNWRLEGCTLYVTLEPCPMCAGAVGWAQISRIVYGAPDPKRGYTTYAPRAFHPKAQVTSGVLAEECKTLIQRFFAGKR